MSVKRSKSKREKQIRKSMGVSRRKKQYRRRGNPFAEEITVYGTFSYSGNGFGFCVPDEEYGMDDVFIPPRKTMGAMTGDRVKVSVSVHHQRSERKYEGAVISVEYLADSIIGTLRVMDGYAYVIPDSKKYNVIIYVPVKDVDVSGAGDNYKVEVIPSGEERFTRTRSITVRGPYDMPYFDTMGRISSVFGSALLKDSNYSAILYSSGIPTEFPEAVLSDAKNAASEEISPAGRKDLRDKTIFTIDGAGAKDLDDAISLEKTESGWILGVHIADVSHYVTSGSPTHEEAVRRGTSVYFTDKVVPMLPESLSNGACSLNAGEDKYALSAEITLDKNGNRVSTKVFKSIIRSSIRGVYSEVNSIFEEEENSEFFEKYKKVYSELMDMKELYMLLYKNTSDRGYIEFEDSESVILVDENGDPVDVVLRERGDGEKLIEQFMLQANMGVAEIMKSRSLPCLYRVHESPDREKLQAFAVFINNIGIDPRGIPGERDEISDAELSARLKEILMDAEKKGISSIVSSVLLRNMMKARYQSVSAHHFGLEADTYCHFTSPIRRYPDLFVHTVISEILRKKNLSELTAKSAVSGDDLPYYVSVAPKLGESSTECEIRAQNAERDIEDLYMALFMQSRIGDVFRVTVCSVIRSGMFVQCENGIEGFVSASCFPGAKINESFMTLATPDKTYTLGSAIDVRLTDVDISMRKITFEPYK